MLKVSVKSSNLVLNRLCCSIYILTVCLQKVDDTKIKQEPEETIAPIPAPPQPSVLEKEDIEILPSSSKETEIVRLDETEPPEESEEDDAVAVKSTTSELEPVKEEEETVEETSSKEDSKPGRDFKVL